MKTAVSIPDEVFVEADRLAKRMKRSRSEIFSRALAEYIARHTPDRVTEAMNRTLAEIDERTDPFTLAAGDRVLSRTEW
jgi:metal-responsive CopG/Arc/MetJ family transcriptional regulator